MYNKQVDKTILEIVDSIRKLSSVNKYPGVEATLQELEKDISNKEFRITVVGEFSSGKSTFLNAIIGKDILPHGVSETTATITYIHNVPKEDSRLGTAVIHFKKKGESDKTISISKDTKALIDYVTTSENQYKVVEDIMYVDVFVHFADTDEPVVLIDTPGMNGVAEGHRELTMKEIQRSHASICLFHLRGLGKTDLEFIKELKKYQSTFFFVLNAVDELKKTEETYESRMKAFTEEISRGVYDGKETPEYVFGVSSLYALAGRDLSIKRLFESDPEEIATQKRNQLINDSRMPVLEHALFKYLGKSDKEKLFYESLISKLKNVLTSLLESADTEQKVMETNKENIPERQLLIELRDKAKIKIEKYRKQMELTIGSMMADLQDNINTHVRQDCDKQLKFLYQDIGNLNIESAKVAVEKNQYGKALSSFWMSESTWLKETIQSEVERIYDDMLTELTVSLPKINFKDKKVSINIDGSAFNYQSVTTSSRLHNLSIKLQQKKQELEMMKDDLSTIDIRDELSSINAEINQIRQERQIKISGMGQRPSVRIWNEPYQVETTSIIRRIFTLGLSHTYETRYRTKSDDSAQREYDREMEQLKRDYQMKDSVLQRQKNTLESELQQAEENEFRIQILQEAIIRLEEQQEQEKRDIKELEKNARSSFFKKRIKEIRELVDKQLAIPEGVLFADLLSGISDNIKLCRQKIITDISALYDRKTQEYINSIVCMIGIIDNEGANKENSEHLKIIKSDIQKIKEIIEQLTSLSYGL